MVASPQEILPEQKGFRRLGDVQPMIGAYQALSGVARRSWAAGEGAALRAFIRAYIEASDWLADPSHKAEAVAIYLARVPNSTAEMARTAWGVMLARYEGFQSRAKFDPLGAVRVMQIRGKYGRPQKPLQDWSRYIDDSFYEEVTRKPRP
jgi:hypothetical protein